MFYQKFYRNPDFNPPTWLIYTDSSKNERLGTIIYYDKEGFTAVSITGETLASMCEFDYALKVFSKAPLTEYDQVVQIIYDEVVPIMQQLLNRAQRRLTRHKIEYLGILNREPKFSVYPRPKNPYMDFRSFFNDGILNKLYNRSTRRGSLYGERFPELVEFARIAMLINYNSSMSAEKKTEVFAEEYAALYDCSVKNNIRQWSPWSNQ